MPPGTQPDAMVSDDLRVGMKRAAADISRSKFEVYNFSTRHDLSEAATDELLQMLSNVGNILVVLSRVFVFSLAFAASLSLSGLNAWMAWILNYYLLSAGQI